ncbi:MAG: S8 family peptidase [Bacteroidota bacterium]
MNQPQVALPNYIVDHIFSPEDVLKIQAKATQNDANWAKRLFGIPQTWQQTQGEGVKIAVLDTGIDEKHPDLRDAIIDGKDFTGEGLKDTNGHGTHCAGIIAARPRQTSFLGVAPKAKILAAKVLGSSGGNYDAIAQGIEWAVEQGADIISMSLGGPKSSQRLYQAIYTALAKEVIIFAAAGNSGSRHRNSIGYPGKYGGVITIAAHDEFGNPSGFSSRGGEIDFLAPGTDIFSTYPNSKYATLDGTSMATPFVAGLAALVEAKHHKEEEHPAGTPLKNGADMREHLMVMATHPGWHTNDAGYGALQPFRYFDPEIIG